MNNEVENYQEAIRHVNHIKSFYHYVFKGMVLSTLLLIINLFSSPEYLWSLWVLVGLSVIGVLKWVNTFGLNALFDKKWQDKKIKKALENNKQAN